MKHKTTSGIFKSFISLWPTTFATALLLCIGGFFQAQAANYAGNLNTGFGGAIGNGVLSVTDDHTNITVNLQRGNSGTLNDVLVIYIDTGIGGATNTAGYTSTGGTEQKAISGFDGGNRSLLTFTNGFRPSHAIAIKNDFMDVWSLANPANFSFLSGTGQGGSGSANFTLTFPSSQLGLANNVTANIKIFGTYISGGGYRSTEAIAGGIVASSFGQGYNPFTNTAYATYTFAPAVVPTYAVKFSVDMSAQVQLGNFVAGTDPVYCGGSFQTNPFAFGDFQLVQSNGTAIYTNTYLVADPTNTVETYKFKFTNLGLVTDFYDSDPNRSFTLKSGGQVLPLVYFDNVPATPSATTNQITFTIDMGPQIYLGHFDPGAGDLIKVYGSFEQPHWSGNFPAPGYLTNNPNLSGNASNIYSGTFVDGNYPGTVTQYKYVIAPGGVGTTYEDGSDRTLVTPTGSVTLPTVFFSGVSTYAATPITFSVDMTVPTLTQQFDFSRGDTVGCAGTFLTNQWAVGSAGFLLTNNPTAANTNIWSGTYVDRNAPGAGERYKFVINTNGGGTAYESPASTGGGDRQFLLGSVAATNPLVVWNDASLNDVLLVDTVVTFTLNMTNAVRYPSGTPFDATQDAVFINGDFAGWVGWNAGNFISAGLICQNNTLPLDNKLYSYTTTFFKGRSRYVQYKYSIAGDDNEAPSGNDHIRYVRGTNGVCELPLDNFGAPTAEPKFGNLAIGNLSGGSLPISWLGYPGVHLQSRSNLVSGSWQDVNATDSQSSTNWPVGSGSQYFRLVQP